jgi:hypothetical protein
LHSLIEQLLLLLLNHRNDLRHQVEAAPAQQRVVDLDAIGDDGLRRLQLQVSQT